MNHALWIDPHQPVVAEVARIAELDLGDAIAALTSEGGQRVDPEGVHLARKRLKRLRALVRLGRGALGKDRAQAENHAYRDLGRQLANRRDADALIETVERLQAGADHDDADLAAALATLHRQLSATAARARQEPDAAATVRSGLEEARTRVRSWNTLLAEGGSRSHDDPAAAGAGQAASDRGTQGTHPDHLVEVAPTDPDGFDLGTGWDLLQPGFLRQYAKGRDAMAALGTLPGNDQLHDWRKRVKDHWHQLELLAPAWPKVLKSTAEEVHHLADLLGDDHDLAELQAQHGPDLDPAVADLVEAERDRLQAAARSLGAKVHAEPPKRLGRRFAAYWPAP